MILACYSSEHVLFIVVAALITNLLGVIAGLMLTNVFGLPNDGSPPPGCDNQPDAEDQLDPQKSL
ncbi:hypothetical protein NG895_03550 [Aeoliella sp. ICT_H6.2]|uniref:Uncharacterized protein n=1 Tax=Aeoliella straminimaris TaxID=2954799 RepID=A0A9X2JHJ7_9BACT|nr:hypothetical protein [Aeoliella straminimaris]MCO6042974.1 hypothetical protein [Aeoliella straminimaris]